MRHTRLIDTFIHAAYSGDIRTLSDILKQEPWLLNHIITAPDALPTTILVEALRNNNNQSRNKVAAFLINKGADISVALDLIRAHPPEIRKSFNANSEDPEQKNVRSKNTEQKTPRYSLSEIREISKVPHPPVKRRPPNL
ncbi:MAG: hypothetical protein KUG81_08285 [Gammaproteobacteria bacterium]|nr:hypothetical protein [Gammaproteobacteria bacterium]